MLRFRRMRKQRPKPYHLLWGALASYIAAVICIVAFSAGPRFSFRWVMIALAVFAAANGTLQFIWARRAS